MEISFISSLTPDDEHRLASAFLRSVGAVLDLLPIAYSIRVKTTSGKTLTRTHSPADLPEPRDAARVVASLPILHAMEPPETARRVEIT